MTAQSKPLVVFGATGQQGGSVINSVLADPRATKESKLRGITRDPSKANARALTARGVEMLAGDLNSKSSLESALNGAHSVCAVTNYWEKMDKDLEIEQGKNIADVALHLVRSSLLNVTKLTAGKFPGVEHFDSRATVESYIRSLPLPASLSLPGFYMSNIPGDMLRPSDPTSPTHNFVFAAPFPSTTPISLLDAANDIGKIVKAMLLNRDKVLGKRILTATEYYTPEDIIKVFQEVYPKAGEGARFERLSAEVYKGMLGSAGMPKRAQEDLYQNMAFMDKFGYYGKEGLGESHAILDEKMTSIKEYMAKVPTWKDLE